jgi:hypothetical protein
MRYLSRLPQRQCSPSDNYTPTYCTKTKLLNVLILILNYSKMFHVTWNCYCRPTMQFLLHFIATMPFVNLSTYFKFFPATNITDIAQLHISLSILTQECFLCTELGNISKYSCSMNKYWNMRYCYFRFKPSELTSNKNYSAL